MMFEYFSQPPADEKSKNEPQRDTAGFKEILQKDVTLCKVHCCENLDYCCESLSHYNPVKHQYVSLSAYLLMNASVVCAQQLCVSWGLYKRLSEKVQDKGRSKEKIRSV